MRLLRSSEPINWEFEGHTSEEAILLARRRVGDEVPLRCWKVRRGGVFGFFARETFVAGVTPPEGAIKRASVSPLAVSSDGFTGTEAKPGDRESTFGWTERVTLSDLVEDTTDEVNLRSSLTADTAFSEILAEAEATLSGTAPIRGKRPVLVDPPSRPISVRIGGLRDGLAKLGVPSQYQPDQSEYTLDGLVRSLSRLPQAEPVPTIGGSVIVVVGGSHDARSAAKHLLRNLDLESSDLIAIERTDSGRQRLQRRRSSNKVTVVVVEAFLRSHGLAEAASWIEKLKPDYVLGAVSATAKRSDVLNWHSQIGRVDSLSLSGLSNTTTPCELFGEIPIAFVDGSRASTLRWVLLLLKSIVESEN